jgi:hypothetical protein
MGDPAMVLGEAELKRIGEYVKGNLKEWLREVEPARAADPVTNTQLLERIARHDERFTFVEQRFELQDKLIADRFQAVDKRFEYMQASMDKRFEAVDKRFTLLTWLIGAGLATSVAIVGILIGA